MGILSLILWINMKNTYYNLEIEVGKNFNG